jgi:hypothetical protein
MSNNRYKRVGAFVLYGCSRRHLRWNGRCTHAAAEPGRGVLDPIDGLDSVAGRDSWFAGSAIVNGQRLGPPIGIRSVAANSNGSMLFANVRVGGIPRSTDGGRTWLPTIDVNSDVHEVGAHPANPDIVATAAAVAFALAATAGDVDHRAGRSPRTILLRSSVFGRRHYLLGIDRSFRA